MLHRTLHRFPAKFAAETKHLPDKDRAMARGRKLPQGRTTDPELARLRDGMVHDR